MNQRKLKTDEFEKYNNDFKWFLENYNSLLENFADKFVAILGNSVIESDSDIKKLKNKLLPKYTKYYSHIYIDFLYSENPNFVL